VGEPVDRKNLSTPGARKARSRSDSNIEIRGPDGLVQVVLTQAFGPRGDNLIGISDVTFDGHPALTLLLRAGKREGLVHLSPVHGDPRKAGFTDIEYGTHCELLCPVSRLPLDPLPAVTGDERTEYFAIYLTPELSDGSVVGISNIWGHYHSRVVDHFELISVYLAQDAALRDGQG
jgi:hypothetical protein